MFIVFLELSVYFPRGYNNVCVTKNVNRKRLVKFNKKLEE